MIGVGVLLNVAHRIVQVEEYVPANEVHISSVVLNFGICLYSSMAKDVPAQV